MHKKYDFLKRKFFRNLYFSFKIQTPKHLWRHKCDRKNFVTSFVNTRPVFVSSEILGATTFSIMTLSIMTFCIITHGKITYSITIKMCLCCIVMLTDIWWVSQLSPLCWVSLCWMSSCWMSSCWMSWRHFYFEFSFSIAVTFFCRKCHELRPIL
jgi:hypothetical protein